MLSFARLSLSSALRRSSTSASSAPAACEIINKEIYQGNSVVRLVLNSAKTRNALSLEMIEELAKELRGINTIQRVRSVIIAHEGPAFSSGHDLKELTTEAGEEHHTKVFERCTNLVQFIQRMQVPVIAERGEFDPGSLLWYDLMPFYASLLSEKTAHQAMLGTMAKIDGDSVRRGFLEALDAAGMDSGRLALDLVRRARSEADGKDGAWLVDQWCWLTYHGANTIHSALIQANALFRRFYVCEDDSCARLLLQRGLTREGDLADRAEIEIRRIGTRIPARLQRAVLEYRAFVLHIESEDAMSSWVKAEGEAVEAAGRADRAKEGGGGAGEGADVRLARRRLDEDAQRASRTAEVRKQKAVDLVETFLRHPGWRETVRVDEKDDDEECRLSDLSALRCRVFCDSLCVLVQLHARSGDARAAIEVAHMVCDDRMNIQQDMSREKLQLVLEAIHSAGGHLLE